MRQNLLEIQDLKVTIDDKAILNGLSLTVGRGETHVLMGPNGAGKSTLVNTIMGHPQYTLGQGRILFEGRDITGESADARARLGLFLSFQSPVEVPGVSLENFLRMAKGAVTGQTPRIFPFQKELRQMMETLGMDAEYASRYLNVGFSGGEKKKSEILQMLMMNPKLAILDETDSGLDVDAVKIVSRGVKAFKSRDNALLIITHNASILEGLDVDFVHILDGGKIVRTGGRDLIGAIGEHGFHALETGASAR